MLLGPLAAYLLYSPNEDSYGLICAEGIDGIEIVSRFTVAITLKPGVQIAANLLPLITPIWVDGIGTDPPPATVPVVHAEQLPDGRGRVTIYFLSAAPGPPTKVGMSFALAALRVSEIAQEAFPNPPLQKE